MAFRLNHLMLILAAAVFRCFLLHPAMAALMCVAIVNEACANPLTHAIMHMQREARVDTQVADCDYGCNEAIHA